VISIDKAKEFLVEWIINHFKQRDIMSKNIESIDKNKDGFDVYVKFKDKEQFVVVMPILEGVDGTLSKFKNKDGCYSIVTFNNRKNFKELVNSWDKLVGFKLLNIFFVNPFSNLDKRWIIYPHTHDKICDKESLEKGLKAMFDMVEPLSEEDIKNKF
jgi:hypothetical protein